MGLVDLERKGKERKGKERKRKEKKGKERKRKERGNERMSQERLEVLFNNKREYNALPCICHGGGI
jgi:hypothetical protein